ncbi:hypothetical protein [Streptomyces acidicola]|uniref:Uncharacterized protein n=1 Tax=Streptomyces acidicola TaxID=2596892 RepID=A0A5N8WKW7_9ACTN|nr:hypothetical protein [Streptomyces acidicola]MPY47128.1 hypothetical protein [Streptomyces acidicola]MPY47267.1 hypothetical protein [Streptomyces acidicola]
MPKIWQPNEAKKFARQVQLGKSYYIVHTMATNLAPYEDPYLYSEVKFTRRLPLTGNIATDGGTSAIRMCQVYGPVYEERPAGLRKLAGPAPQVAGPLGADYEGVLDEPELRGLEKQAAQTSDPRKRRPLGGWRV